MKPGTHIALLAVLVVAIALNSSCITSNSASSSARADKKVFAVNADAAAFYYHGPGQGSGPDKTLPKGTLVTMIRPSFGHCKVRLATGEKGYVANDDLHIASPLLIATASTVSPNPVTPANLPSDAGQPQFRASEPSPDFEPTPIPIPPNLAN
jgi:hypothetical protein